MFWALLQCAASIINSSLLLCAALQLPVVDHSAPGSDRLGFSRANRQLAGLGLSHLGGMSSDDLMGLSGPLPPLQGGSAGRLGEAEAVWAALAASSQAWPAVPTAGGREDHRVPQEGWATFPEVSHFTGRVLVWSVARGCSLQTYKSCALCLRCKSATFLLRVSWSQVKMATVIVLGGHSRHCFALRRGCAAALA